MTQDTKVDWIAPIEAVHEDGRVVPCSFIKDDRTSFLPMVVEGVPEDGPESIYAEGYFERDGTRRNSKWHIRNVEQPQNMRELPTPTNEVRERMEALVRRLADSVSNEELYGGWAWRDEARAIVALLNPVDGDLIEARKIVDGRGINPDDPEYHVAVGIADAAIKRGRALAEAGK